MLLEYLFCFGQRIRNFLPFLNAVDDLLKRGELKRFWGTLPW